MSTLFHKDLDEDLGASVASVLGSFQWPRFQWLVNRQGLEGSDLELN